MTKKNSLVFLTLFVIGFFTLSSVSISAQIKVEIDAQDSSKIDKVLQNYIALSALSMDKRRTYFSEKLSPEDKANIFKLHLAFQLVKRPNLSAEQKDLILESLPMITPDSYDAAKPQKRNDAQQQATIIASKIKASFSQQESSEIFASLGGNQEDSLILQRFQNMNNLKTRVEKYKVYDNFSPQSKSDFWKLQFAISLLQDFTLAQKSLVVEAIANVTPDLYQTGKTDDLKIKRENLMPLIEKISIAFPSEIRIPIFTIVGKDEVDSMNLEAARCHCLLDSWFSGCGVGSTCQGGNCNDNPDNGTHCGFAGLWACDGRCVTNENSLSF